MSLPNGNGYHDDYEEEDEELELQDELDAGFADIEQKSVFRSFARHMLMVVKGMR